MQKNEDRIRKWGRIKAEWICTVCLALCFLAILFAQGTVRQVTVADEKDTKEQQKAETKKKIAYLTFDDGPSGLTEEYLKILEEEKVPATFFLIGQQVEGDMLEIAKKEVAQGHEIGIHTYSHEAEKIYQSKECYCKDLQKTKVCIEEKLKVTPQLFRFPWGSANAYIRSYKSDVIDQMACEGMDYADWNVSGEDSVGCPSVDSIVANVRKDYQKYYDPVILLHDSASCKATLQALRPIIKELKENGYSFQTLSKRKRPCHFGEY